ncbi:MAG: hypothetical protein CM15mP106_2530 [Candidatus Neomarinimicrobiota bacterium]|nr:MAG: hypothetical protein CM15mP106_2530 [Candidatus Neomarinimicrobiota bacterium]
MKKILIRILIVSFLGYLFFLLFPHLVYTCRMISPLKKMIVMIFWMSIAAGLVIGLDAIFEFPDEVSGVAYFICIGIAASGTLFLL